MAKGKSRCQVTSAASAESSVSVAALGAHPNHLSVNVLGVVGVDVAGAATAVRNLGSRHFAVLRRTPREYLKLLRYKLRRVCSWQLRADSSEVAMIMGCEGLHEKRQLRLIMQPSRTLPQACKNCQARTMSWPAFLATNVLIGVVTRDNDKGAVPRHERGPTLVAYPGITPTLTARTNTHPEVNATSMFLPATQNEVYQKDLEFGIKHTYSSRLDGGLTFVVFQDIR